ncbi:hypothetical protein AB3S75_027648 [Citrus x aurantiifolia]
MSPPSRHRFLLFGYPTPFGATSRRRCQFLYLLQQCGFRYSLLEHSLICKRILSIMFSIILIFVFGHYAF